MFPLFLWPCHDVQSTFAFVHLKIYQNLFDGTSKSLSFAYHILLAMIIHNQQGPCAWICDDKHPSQLELKTTLSHLISIIR